MTWKTSDYDYKLIRKLFTEVTPSPFSLAFPLFFSSTSLFFPPSNIMLFFFLCFSFLPFLPSTHTPSRLSTLADWQITCSSQACDRQMTDVNSRSVWVNRSHQSQWLLKDKQSWPIREPLISRLSDWSTQVATGWLVTNIPVVPDFLSPTGLFSML